MAVHGSEPYARTPGWRDYLILAALIALGVGCIWAVGGIK